MSLFSVTVTIPQQTADIPERWEYIFSSGHPFPIPEVMRFMYTIRVMPPDILDVLGVANGIQPEYMLNDRLVGTLIRP